MNQKLPYEQLIADKMQHLPLPDADESWQVMKKLLDSEMPPSAGGGRNGFAPRKWWWLGAAIVLLFGVGTASIYLGSGGGISSSSDLASENANQSNSKQNIGSVSSPENKNSKATIDQNSTQNSQANSSAANQENQDKESTADGSVPGLKNSGDPEQSGQSGNVAANSIGKADSKDQASVSKPTSASRDGNAAVPGNSESKSSTNPNPKKNAVVLGSGAAIGRHTTTNKNGNQFAANATRNGNHGKTLNGSGKTGTQKYSNSGAGANGAVVASGFETNSGTASRGNNSGTSSSKKNKGKKAGIQEYVYSKSYEDYKVNLLEASADPQAIRYTNQKDWKNWELYSDSRKIDESSVPFAPNTANAKSASMLSKKDVEKKMRTDARKEKHEDRLANRKPFFGEKTDRWFAAGLAPYQNFAISSQEAYNYNSSANKGIATDYIPAPYLQFHLTDKVYVLGEFQFNSPQATSSVLLSQKNFYQAGQDPYQQNIYLRKMYYFNMPLSFYYSPIKNFYLGSGLQFSSLNSGIAYMEQVNSGNQLLYSETFKIKDDSLAAKLSGSEWRYLFDANYYWNRFMFGFRYNQALGDYINVQINNTTSKARNQAFALYFRYNIIVSSRKGSQYDPLKY